MSTEQSKADLDSVQLTLPPANWTPTTKYFALKCFKMSRNVQGIFSRPIFWKYFMNVLIFTITIDATFVIIGHSNSISHLLTYLTPRPTRPSHPFVVATVGAKHG